MTVPNYQSLMHPLLKIIGDGQEHILREVVGTLALHLKLSDEDRKEMLSSGRQTKFNNRVAWARTYLGKAGLLESTGRGKFCITKRGLSVLKENPPEISNRFLERYPEFCEFTGKSVRV